MSNNNAKVHVLPDDRFFTEAFQEAASIGGTAVFPEDRWLQLTAPVIQEQDLIIEGNRSEIKQAFDGIDSDGKLVYGFTHKHQADSWGSRDLVVNNLSYYGDSVRADAGGAFDCPNMNQGKWNNVRARRVSNAWQIRTFGEDGQCEHNDMQNCSWSQVGAGVVYATNPLKPKGGHKGTKWRHALGHNAFVNVYAQAGVNNYTGDFDEFHFWSSTDEVWLPKPWNFSVGFWLQSRLSGVGFDGSMEVHWPHRAEMRVIPFYVHDALGVEDVRNGHLHLTNVPANAGDASLLDDVFLGNGAPPLRELVRVTRTGSTPLAQQ